MRFKPKTITFRVAPEMSDLLQNAAREVGAPPSRLLREFVRDGAELILRDPRVARELRRKYAVS